MSRKAVRKLSTGAWFGIGCGIALVLGLIVIAVGWWMLTGKPALPPEATDTVADPGAPGPGVPSSPGAPGSPGASGGRAPVSAPPLEEQIRRVEQAGRTRQPTNVSMVVRESELNDLLATRDSSQVRNMRVYFGDGTLVATGETDWRGRSVQLTVRGRPVVSNGQVSIEVSEVLVGRLPAPEAVRSEVSGELNRGLSDLLGTKNVHVESLQVRPDAMTILGRVSGQ